MTFSPTEAFSVDPLAPLAPLAAGAALDSLGLWMGTSCSSSVPGHTGPASYGSSSDPDFASSVTALEFGLGLSTVCIVDDGGA
eukprot:CAMPEP_0114644880 /NCGR_PEP_ID=MMETSP0191-20121206/4221_1 /TAXON_ID=126664 /ORGANISM="Sorites sp." /LENGTH=82 /DNA_ID=CAMNT_0001857407 /DNA_START=181 /DNA_END=429 /DNA_ORIENTATION=-